jgi:hypothetical protein
VFLRLTTDRAQAILDQMKYMASPQYQQDLSAGKAADYQNQLLSSVPNLPLEGGYNLAEAGIGAGVGAVGGGATAAMLSGAVTGSIVPGVGTAIGAGLGLASGFVGKLAGEQRQDVKNAFRIFQGSQKNMGSIIDEVNAGRMSATDAVVMWNSETQEIAHAKRLLKWQTKDNVNRFLSGGMDELIKIEEWEEMYPVLRAQLANAMAKPNPTAPTSLNYMNTMELE